VIIVLVMAPMAGPNAYLCFNTKQAVFIAVTVCRNRDLTSRNGFHIFSYPADTVDIFQSIIDIMYRLD
jgi:hypothetical protein